MYNHDRLLEREIAFTRAYLDNRDADKSIREYECLKVQVGTLFCCVEKGDLFAGRIDRPLIGVWPIIETDEGDRIGYTINKERCQELLSRMEAEGGYTQAEIAETKEMISFWCRENTTDRMMAEIPAALRRFIDTDDYVHLSRGLYPINRLTGFNPDAHKLLRLGLRGLADSIFTRATKAETEEARIFLDSAGKSILLLIQVVKDYIADVEEQLQKVDDLSRRKALLKLLESLVTISKEPPKTYRDALQLLLIYHISARFAELGRMDDYLGGFYTRDIRTGEITRDEAIELTNNFFEVYEGDDSRPEKKASRHDERVILGGYGRENEADADDYSMMILDTLERYHYIRCPQISLRVYNGMNEALFDKALRLIGNGYGYPILYNDEVNIPSVMRAMDINREMAEQYTFMGCGEFQIAAQATGTPDFVFNTAKMLELMLHNGDDMVSGVRQGLEQGKVDNKISFTELKERFKKQLDAYADACGEYYDLLVRFCGNELSFLYFSALADDCIDRGKACFSGGLRQVGCTVETYGNITAYDSLAAIKDVVFDKKSFTIEHLMRVLDANFEGYDMERQLLLNAPKFGNDNDLADAIAVEMHEYLCNALRRQRDAFDSFDWMLAVNINNSMNVVTGKHVLASADGRCAHVYLSNGNNPTAGCDREGLPALINSFTKMDTSIHACGNQNLKLSPEYFRGDMGRAKQVLKVFFKKGGQQVNLSVVNQADLEDAMIHPEKHENLLVRVGGYTARFVQLEPDIQRDILARSAY